MPTTDVAGHGGDVTLPSGLNLSINAWSATVDIDLIEIPASFGSPWNTHALGQGKITGSLTGKVRFDGASTKPITFPATNVGWTGFVGTAALIAAGGTTANSFTATFVFHRFQFERPHASYMTVTCDFANAGTDGAINWDETP